MVENSIIENRNTFYSFLDGFSEEAKDTLVIDVSDDHVEEKLKGVSTDRTPHIRH